VYQKCIRHMAEVCGLQGSDWEKTHLETPIFPKLKPKPGDQNASPTVSGAEGANARCFPRWANQREEESFPFRASNTVARDQTSGANQPRSLDVSYDPMGSYVGSAGGKRKRRVCSPASNRSSSMNLAAPKKRMRFMRFGVPIAFGK